MKKINIITNLVLVFFLVSVYSSCTKEGEDVRPGLWIENSTVNYASGGTVSIKGQASNYIGLRSVSFSCPAWDINHTISINNEKVWDFEETFTVPATATDDQDMLVTAEDKNGSQQKVAVRMIYAPSEHGLTIEDWKTAYEVTSTGTSASYDMAIKVKGNAVINKAIVTIVNPDGVSNKYSKEFAPNATSATLTDTPIAFNDDVSEDGSYVTYPMMVEVNDVMGNKKTFTSKLVVTKPEQDNGYAGVTNFYMIRCDENGNIEDPDNYAYGYYRYLDPDNNNQYAFSLYDDVKEDGTITPRTFYAKAGDKFYFVSEQNVKPGKKDYNLFGMSPIIDGKLINNNGYVVPLTVEEEGYYNLWVSLPEHQVKLTKASTSNAYSGDLMIGGPGTSSADPSGWYGMYTLTKSSTYRYTVEITPAEGLASYQFLFFQCGTWTDDWTIPQFRGDDKWWWIANAGSTASFQPGNAKTLTVTFDTEEMWATIKKPATKQPTGTSDKEPSGPQL